MNSLSAIGITTGDWREKGKLHINEDKLRDAIAKDPDAVMRLFNASGENFSSQGVANRMYDILKVGVAVITEKAGGGEFEKSITAFWANRLEIWMTALLILRIDCLEPKNATGKSLLPWNRPYNMLISKVCGWPRK